MERQRLTFIIFHQLRNEQRMKLFFFNNNHLVFYHTHSFSFYSEYLKLFSFGVKLQRLIYYSITSLFQLVK